MTGPAGIPDEELTAWAQSRRTDQRIAAALVRQIRDSKLPAWHPIEANPVLARAWDCSPGTAGRAKRLLRDRGVLVCQNRAYYVAPASPAGGER